MLRFNSRIRFVCSSFFFFQRKENYLILRKEKCWGNFEAFELSQFCWKKIKNRPENPLKKVLPFDVIELETNVWLFTKRCRSAHIAVRRCQSFWCLMNSMKNRQLSIIWYFALSARDRTAGFSNITLNFAEPFFRLPRHAEPEHI